MITRIQQATKSFRSQLLDHPLYSKIQEAEDIATFMQYHIYAVWDFMSLLKALQIQLSCVQIPWKPNANPSLARLINEIVLAEESDIDEEGNPKSHFDLYLDAMQAMGADTSSIHRLLSQVDSISDLVTFLEEDEQTPVAVKRFLSFSFQLIEDGKAHKIAAAFTFGREELIPDLFTEVVTGLSKEHPSLAPFIYYLDRHISLDGDEHGPLALQMISELCREDEQKWEEAQQAAVDSLAMRRVLWDGIYEALTEYQLSEN